jgi:hypothetical protein
MFQSHDCCPSVHRVPLASISITDKRTMADQTKPNGTSTTPTNSGAAMLDMSPKPLEHDLTGGCLCGSVRYTIRAGATPFYSVVCHCTNCKRATGAQFVANTVWKKAVSAGSFTQLTRAWVDTENTRSPKARSLNSHHRSSSPSARRPPPITAAVHTVSIR